MIGHVGHLKDCLKIVCKLLKVKKYMFLEILVPILFSKLPIDCFDITKILLSKLY